MNTVSLEKKVNTNQERDRLKHPYNCDRDHPDKWWCLAAINGHHILKIYDSSIEKYKCENCNNWGDDRETIAVIKRQNVER